MFQTCWHHQISWSSENKEERYLNIIHVQWETYFVFHLQVRPIRGYFTRVEISPELWIVSQCFIIHSAQWSSISRSLIVPMPTMTRTSGVFKVHVMSEISLKSIHEEMLYLCQDTSSSGHQGIQHSKERLKQTFPGCGCQQTWKHMAYMGPFMGHIL